jgi:hypothetical protein
LIHAKIAKSFLKSNKCGGYEKNALFLRKRKESMPSKNPFAFKAKQQNKKKSSGKRVGKSKPEKANNQLNRRVK